MRRHKNDTFQGSVDASKAKIQQVFLKNVIDTLKPRDTMEPLAEFSQYLEKIMSLLSLGIPAGQLWKYLEIGSAESVENFKAPKQHDSKQALQNKTSVNETIIELVRQRTLNGEQVSSVLDETVHLALDRLKLKPRNLKTEKTKIKVIVLGLWRDLGLCWRLAEEHGLSLSALLDMFRQHAENRMDLEYRRQTTLAGPMMSVKIMLVLPFVALAMTSLLGMNTIGVLLGTPLGWGCCCVAASALLLARRWSMSMIAKAQGRDFNDYSESLGIKTKKASHEKPPKPQKSHRSRSRRGGESLLVDTALILDVLGGLLECGMSADHALDSLNPYITQKSAKALREKGFGQAHGLGELEIVASIVELSYYAGAPSRKMLASQANWLRKRKRHELERKAELLGVKVVVPLGVCVLPAFFCLAVIPIVVELAAGIF